MIALLATLTVFSANAANVVSLKSSDQVSSMTAVSALEGVFARSEEAHMDSMASIMKSMSEQKAWQVLSKNNLTTPALIEVSNALHGNHGRKSSLRKQPKGYAGLDGARQLLNDMIFQANTKYDEEIAKCTAYYSEQCHAMEACRGQIAASNYVAAHSKTLMLDSQDRMDKAEKDIAEGKEELKEHNRKCHEELTKFRARLKVLSGDIEIMEGILKLTECGDSLLDTKNAMLSCKDPCTKKRFVTFNHELRTKMSHLRSATSHKLLQDTFSDHGGVSLESTSFLQLGKNISNDTSKLATPPVPRTEPQGPCGDPYAGGPKPPTAKAGCELSPGSCKLLQERFLLIQSGLKDDKEGLLLDIASMEKYCKETKETIQAEITNNENIQSEAQTALGEATGKEARASETSRQTTKKNEELDADLRKQMKACQGNYLNLESEMCALKKIRGEIYKMAGDPNDPAPYFVDCKVGPWKPEECTKVCKRPNEDAGEQTIEREVEIEADKGAECLPQKAIRKCNEQPCPVDCKLASWGGWSKCSAECGGGVQQRLRLVIRMQQFDGQACGELSETRACNAEACEVDCGLSEWTKWSWCSKDCDGGTRKRVRFVTKQPEGQGECPDAWSDKRLEYVPCNEFECLSKGSGSCSTYDTDDKEYTCETLPNCCEGHQGMGFVETSPGVVPVQCYPSSYATDGMPGLVLKHNCGPQPMKCNKELDIVLLLDGSGSLGQAGWDAEIVAAEAFVDSFNGFGDYTQAQMSVILYSGPGYWAGVRQCFRANGGADMETDCKIVRVTKGFTNNFANVKTEIAGLAWPKGSTLTSLALYAAKAELANGRKEAESIVVTITDGRPISYGKTTAASRSLRKQARLLWVPVTQNAPLKYIKRWATRRWKENVVQVDDFEHLEQPYVITHIIADICPSHSPEIHFG
jgi:hypothetical protein